MTLRDYREDVLDSSTHIFITMTWSQFAGYINEHDLNNKLDVFKVATGDHDYLAEVMNDAFDGELLFETYHGYTNLVVSCNFSYAFNHFDLGRLEITSFDSDHNYVFCTYLDDICIATHQRSHEGNIEIS